MTNPVTLDAHSRDMLSTLEGLSGWISHWQTDAQYGLAPTPESLAIAKHETTECIRRMYEAAGIWEKTPTIPQQKDQ